MNNLTCLCISANDLGPELLGSQHLTGFGGAFRDARSGAFRCGAGPCTGGSWGFAKIWVYKFQLLVKKNKVSKPTEIDSGLPQDSLGLAAPWAAWMKLFSSGAEMNFSSTLEIVLFARWIVTGITLVWFLGSIILLTQESCVFKFFKKIF